jgi:hypothetical protein
LNCWDVKNVVVSLVESNATNLEFVLHPLISLIEQIPEKIQVDTAGELLVPFAAEKSRGLLHKKRRTVQTAN